MCCSTAARSPACWRSEEHTSELQSRQYLVCRLLLEKKKQPSTSWPREARTECHHIPLAESRGRVSCFFFNDTATTEIYTLSLHDALPIAACWWPGRYRASWLRSGAIGSAAIAGRARRQRSEEHTSELQSRQYLVCRL